VRRKLVLLAVVTCLLAPAAAAAGVSVRVDTSDYPNVRVTVVTSSPTKHAPALLEDGKPVSVVSAQNLASNANVALLIDTSRSMAGASLTNAKAAASEFLATKPAGDQVALFTFGSTALQLTSFSTSLTDADQQLRSMTVDAHQGTALYDAVSLASSQLAGQPGARLILLVTDGRDISSKGTLTDALRAAHRAHTTIYTIGIRSRQFTPSALQSIARNTGGVFHSAGRGDLVGIYHDIGQELRRTWVMEYVTAGRPGQTLGVTATAPGNGSGSQEVKLTGQSTVATSKPSLPKPVFSTGGTVLLALAVGLLLMVAARVAFRKSRSEEMRRRIQPHVAEEKKKLKQKRDRTSFLRGLFASTEHVLGRTKPWSRLARLLERGDVPLKTVEFAYVILGAGLFMGFFLSVAGLSGIFPFVGFVFGGSLPLAYVWRKARKRLLAFDDQLPDLLMSTAASLKAGHSFKQAIQTIVDEAEDPARKEFNRVLAETSLGRPIEEALTDMADRLGSKNFAFIVTAVTIQNQVGGSLAGLFDMVADTVRQRQQFARKIKALTAMGRASAYVLIALPIFLAALMSLIDHAYMAPLFTTSAGQTMIMVGLVMMAIGSVILRKIVSFKE
jgi:tight adherence protein B